VVIDQNTHAVYGHVIGSNPMSQVYVVPFKYIIEQIKLTFGTSAVSLYDPIKPLEAVEPTVAPSSIKFNSGCQALIPYRSSDSYLLSLTKTNHKAGQIDSQEDHAAEDRGHQQYTMSYDAFTCVCGRRYRDFTASPLNLEKFFRKAPRPTSSTEVLAFWLSMLDVIRLKTTRRYLKDSVPKESASQNSLICRQPEQSCRGISSELMSLHVLNPAEGNSQLAAVRNLRTSSNESVSTELIQIPPAIWPERGTSPCSYCEVREKLRRPYDLWAIGTLLLESLVWVLAGQDGLNDLQQRRRNINTSPADGGLQLFNKESVSLHAKAIAKGDSASLEVLQLTERILNQDLDFPELWRWQQKMSEEFERILATMRKKPNFLGKRTSNKRALDSFISQNFARNPVIDPDGPPEPRTTSKFRDLVRRFSHNLVRILS